jgi:hypothetical protein
MKAFYTIEAIQNLGPETMVSDEERDRKYPGEDDLFLCGRCKKYHRKGAPGHVEEARIIKKISDQLLQEIDAELIRELRSKV